MEEGRRLQNLNPYDLHKLLINEYLLVKKGSTALLKRDKSKDKTDFDVIKENHQFLWDDDNSEDISWEKKLAKKYYDKLFKEYCIGDLSRYKENKVGLRWRTEQELIDGKGQFTCGNKKCSEENGLRTWEVNFSYVEHGEKKNALVKLRLCPDCSYKLNYHHKRKEVKRLKKGHRRKEKDEFPAASESEVTTKAESVTDESEKTNFGNKSDGSEIWQQETAKPEEKSREDEFQEYLDALFL